jgi:hypothetical protein
MKRIIIIIISLFIITNAIADKKDITNLNFKPSVDKGKIGKAYEIVTAESGDPVIGKSSYKFIAIPFDCGKDRDSSHSDCGTLDKKKNTFISKGDRVRSELGAWDKNNRFRNEQWFSFSIYIPEDYKTISPTITSFYQIYETGKGPALKIEDSWGTMIANIKIKGGTVEEKNLLSINDMKGKWTHVVMNNNYSKNKDKGFYNIWVNSNYAASYKGQTHGGAAKGLYVKAGLYQSFLSRYLKIVGMDPNWEKGQDPGEFPTQIIYMDNIFKAKSKEKLKEIITKVYGASEIPNGLNLDLLNIEEVKQVSYKCGDSANPTWYCAIASRKSDPTIQFFTEDPNERTARIKATRECFKEYADCTVVFSGKN